MRSWKSFTSPEVPHKVSCGVGFGPVTSLRQDQGPVGPLNSVTKAETDLSVSRNQELENLVDGAKCWAWGLILGYLERETRTPLPSRHK